MKLRRQIGRLVVTWAALLLFMISFQPAKLPVIVLILPFVLLFAALYSLWHLVSALRSRYYTKTRYVKPHHHLGGVMCWSAVRLLVLQSLTQLPLRDVVTVVAIVVLGYLYLMRSRFTVPKQ